MLAHRRHDVADLNQRARELLRGLGRIAADQLVTDHRAFAVGDRVLARRNDRRLAVVNGDSGQIAVILDGRPVVALDDGRTVEITDAYVRAGHLEHGYALTAHLAQGATVECAFVLGSDELYREWGYTALSRHTTEARFYLTATPAFLNQAPEPLDDTDVPRRLARMLRDSRAEHLALHDATPEDLRPLLLDQVEQTARDLADTDQALQVLNDQRTQTRWHERGRRAGLDRAITDHHTAREHLQHELDRLTAELAQHPAPPEPVLWRGHDPLARLDPARELAHEHARHRGLTRQDDRGMGLGL